MTLGVRHEEIEGEKINLQTNLETENDQSKTPVASDFPGRYPMISTLLLAFMTASLPQHQDQTQSQKRRLISSTGFDIAANTVI